MTKKPLREISFKALRYMPCPCLKRENGGDTLCINGEEVNDIQFVDLGFIPTRMLTDKIPNDSLCLNVVDSDDDGFLRCGTSRRLIKIRNYQIRIESYLDALKKVKELYNGDLVKVNSCPECLYKTIVSKLGVQGIKQEREEKEYADTIRNC
ncbi:MAG: hypothetical protein ACFFCD_10625 [Promethearchaeota archaeon]